jgi:hypothetical protein
MPCPEYGPATDFDDHLVETSAFARPWAATAKIAGIANPPNSHNDQTIMTVWPDGRYPQNIFVRSSARSLHLGQLVRQHD